MKILCYIGLHNFKIIEKSYAKFDEETCIILGNPFALTPCSYEDAAVEILKRTCKNCGKVKIEEMFL